MFVFVSIFTVLTVSTVLSAVDPVTYFYEDLGCTKSDGAVHYECPDFRIRNGTCQFKKFNFKQGEKIEENLLRGSCQHCTCSPVGRIECVTAECFPRFEPGCSHLRYSLDLCCAVGSVCHDTKIECEIDGSIYKEGMLAYPKDSCEICLCDKGFKHEEPFCTPRKCYDQARHQLEVSNFAAPAFFKGADCCPDSWVPVEDDKAIIKINANPSATSDVSCKYGDKKVALGYGFKTSIQPYGRVVQLTCECTTPPYVICRED